MTVSEVQLPSGDETLKGTARSLLASVNDASAAARNGWLFFLALLAYLFIAAASVSHKDLLLNTPVVLPFLGIALRLDSFFLFAPMVMLFMHFGLLVQHVLLSRKIIELDTILSEDEAWRGKRSHPLRLELHSYYYTQALAGAGRSAVFATFLHGMVWMSLVLLPVFLILYFQVTFLPYHNEGITWAHRIYLMIEIVILLGVGIFLRKPNANFWQAVWRTSTEYSTNFFVTISAVLFALFFSICIATFPDEWIDRQLKTIGGWTKIIKRDAQTADIAVFSPTAYFFADTGHTMGGFKGLFRRNLVVVDEDLVPNDANNAEEISISLRGRNLRYANLSRSDLHKADFTGAQLDNAILEGAVLNNAKFGCTVPPDDSETDPTRETYVGRGCATLSRANFTSAELKGADFKSTYAKYARFNNAQMQGAEFDRSILTHATFDTAKGSQTLFRSAFLYESSFEAAQMPGADFSGVVALATVFDYANLRGATFSFSHLQGSKFESAFLNGADLTLAGLWSTNFTETGIDGSDFTSVELWGPIPPEGIEGLKVYYGGMKIAPPNSTAQDGLKKVLERDDLRKETRELIETMLSDKSMKEWQNTEDFKTWTTAKKKFEDADADALKAAYTQYFVKVACDNVRVEKDITVGIIVRASKDNFKGDIETFLKEMQKPSCNVFGLISKDLQDELLTAVDRKRNSGG